MVDALGNPLVIQLTPSEYDKEQYKERNLVECCINKLKQYRRVFSRFEKLAARYLAFLGRTGTKTCSSPPNRTITAVNSSS